MDDRWSLVLSGIARRWLTILLVVLAPWILDLSPAARPLVDSLRQASLAISGNEGAPAAEALAHALTWVPTMPEVRWTAAKLAQADDEPGLALQLLEEGELPAAADHQCLRNQAQIGLASPMEAVPLLTTAPASCPPPMATIQSLAQTALAQQDPQTAATLYQTLVQFQPEQESHWRHFAWTQALIDPAEAAATCRQVIELATDPDPLCLDLINVIELAQVENEASFSFAQVGQAFLQHQQWLEASLAFAKAIELDPDYFEARAYLGLALLQGDQPTAALEQLQQAHQAAPEAPLPASLLSTYWLQAGDPVLALVQAEIAHRADPANPAFTAQLAAAQAALGDLQSAQSLYEEAVELSQGQAQFWRLLAEFYLRHEIDIRQAGRAAARQAYLLEPGARTADTVGYAHFLSGEPQLAERYLQEALHHDPTFAPAHYHLGLVLADSSRLERAHLHFQQAIELDPEGTIGELASRALGRLDR